MKKFLYGMTCAASLLILLAFTQSDPLQAIRDAIAQLGLRIDRLESAAGGGSAAAPGATADSTSRKMIMVSVHDTNNPNVNDDEIADLKHQCAALMNTINSTADKSATDMGDSGNVGGIAYRRGGVDGYNNTGGTGSVTGGEGGGAIAQAMGDDETEARYATLHAIKLQKLQALQDAAKSPTQLILGHNGKIIITLESKIDLTSQLNNIPIGATVTWVGTRLSADDTSETWRIESISQLKTK